MAIYLPKADITFYEMPKTGTTWVRTALNRLGIDYQVLNPEGLRVDPYHSPWWCYPHQRIRICTIRYPLDWYASYWKFHQFEGKPRPPQFKMNTWYIRRPLHFTGTGDVGPYFNQWLEYVMAVQPSYYTRMVEAFFGPMGYPAMTHVMRTERLVTDLSAILEFYGYGDRYDELITVDPVKVSNSQTVYWDGRLADRVRFQESEVIQRFYGS